MKKLMSVVCTMGLSTVLLAGCANMTASEQQIGAAALGGAVGGAAGNRVGGGLGAAIGAGAGGAVGSKVENETISIIGGFVCRCSDNDFLLERNR